MRKLVEVLGWAKAHPVVATIVFGGPPLILLVLILLFPEVMGGIAALAVVLILLNLDKISFFSSSNPVLVDHGDTQFYALLQNIYAGGGWGWNTCFRVIGYFIQGPIEVIRVAIERPPDSTYTAEKFKSWIQERINERFANYDVLGIPARNPDGTIPGYEVLDVYETDKGYILSVVYLNSKEKYQGLAEVKHERELQNLFSLTDIAMVPEDDEF